MKTDLETPRLGGKETMQPELALDAAPEPVSAKVLRARADVPVLEACLRAAALRCMPWMNAREIITALAADGHGVWPDKRVRDAASESLAVASGPGSPGYALAECATPEQLMHIGAALCSQAGRMFARGQRLRTAATLRMKTDAMLATADAGLAEHLAGGTH